MYEFIAAVWLAFSGQASPSAQWHHVTEARRVAVYKNMCSIRCRESGPEYLADTFARRAQNSYGPCIVKGGVAVHGGKALSNGECNSLNVY